MATVTKSANAHTVVATGWTNPSGAYTKDDASFASAPLGISKNITYTGDFGFPDFTEVPSNAVINSITLTLEGYISAAVTGGLVGVQLWDNGVAQGTETTTSSTTETTITQVVSTGVTATEVRSASTLLKARGRCSKGNTSTDMTGFIEYLSMTVDYSVPSSNADLSSLSFSGLTISPTFSASTLSYSAAAPNATSTTTVTAVRADSTATLEYRVNGGAYVSLTSGVASSTINLSVGANTVDVRVTAQDTTTIKVYNTTINRAAPLAPRDFKTNITVNGTLVSLDGHTHTSSGAPVDATYVVTSANTTLSNERVLTSTSSVTVTDNGTTAVTISVPTGGITTTEILDGTITNTDINAAAGIVDTKLATISTANKVANSATTATSASTANAIVARDASQNFSANIITANLTGTASGNVALSTVTNTGDLIVATGSGSVTRLAAGTSGYVLTSNGLNTQPTWQVAPSGSGGSTSTTTLIKWGLV